jgi:hypothetical protein
MEAKNYSAACPKLVESNRLDPGSGTLLAMALCHEGEGKTATAWSEFAQVATATNKERRADRHKLAREHMASLETVLSHVTVDVPGAVREVPGLEVKWDGTVIGKPAWGTPMPADPGLHVVEASAPGKNRFSTRVDVGAKADVKRVSIVLADEDKPVARPATQPPVPATTPTTTPPTPEGHGRRTVGLVVGGVGVAGLGVGAFFGVRAITTNADAKALCGPPPCSDPDAVNQSRKAVMFANIANVGIGVGAVGLALGTFLLLTDTSSTPPSGMRVTPVVGSRGGGAAVGGAF